MSAQWFYAQNNNQHGPVTSEQLKQMALNGQLQPDDLVWKEGLKEWKKAISLKGLFSNSPDLPYPDSSESPIVHLHHFPLSKSATTAALLEILPGFFIQTFGIGHIYAGNILTGLLFMLGYWFVQLINLVLCFVLVGFVTFVLCWIGFMIVSPIIAAKSCEN